MKEREKPGMYESLTRWIPKLEKDRYGEWVRAEDGFPLYVAYSWNVRTFAEAVFCFADDHCAEHAGDFHRVLEEHRIPWSRKAMKGAEVSALDGRTAYALLLAAVRAERSCPGALLDFCASGCVVRWLRRLQETDGENCA